VSPSQAMLLPESASMCAITTYARLPAQHFTRRRKVINPSRASLAVGDFVYNTEPRDGRVISVYSGSPPALASLRSAEIWRDPPTGKKAAQRPPT
jgi:hypothetical protein